MIRMIAVHELIDETCNEAIARAKRGAADWETAGEACR